MSETKKRRSTGKATLSDVAKLAGVGAMTVSRALRTPELVSGTLREKIDIAINELDYRPNFAASSLASAASHQLIAVITTHFNENGSDKLLNGLQETLAAEGYTILLIDASYHLGSENDLLSSLSSANLAAIILLNIENTPVLQQWLTAKNIPTMNIGALPNKLADYNIDISNMMAMYHLTKSVIKKGYQNIALLCANQDQIIFQQRMKGWMKALLEHHFSPHRVINAASEPSFCTGSKFLPEFILNWPEIDVLVCTSDELACGALYECQRRHIRIPKQLAIVGFGDSEFSQVCQPPLTTIAIPYYQIGVQAGNELLQQLKPNKKFKPQKLADWDSLIQFRSTL